MEARTKRESSTSSTAPAWPTGASGDTEAIQANGLGVIPEGAFNG
jgi:hypothetical protein